MSRHAAATRAQRVALESAKAYSSAVDAGGATVLGIAEAPDSPMVNRIVGLGLGLDRPATEADAGRGAQSALLATRIRHAAELGCDLVVTETGERREDRPSNSYRNILRAGFTEHAVTANWLGRSPSE